MSETEHPGSLSRRTVVASGAAASVLLGTSRRR